MKFSEITVCSDIMDTFKMNLDAEPANRDERSVAVIKHEIYDNLIFQVKILYQIWGYRLSIQKWNLRWTLYIQQ